MEVGIMKKVFSKNEAPMKTYKTFLAMLATIAAFASCSKENLNKEAQDIEVALNISYADDTKAIQKSFMSGNVIYILFNDDYKKGSAEESWENGKYLKMVYNGTEWAAASTAYLSSIPTTGTMNALYLSAEGTAYVSSMSISPFRLTGTGVDETLPNGEEASPCYDAQQAEAVPYTITNGKLEGSVKLERGKPTNSTSYHINLQISVKNIPAELYNHEWYLKSETLQLRQICYGTPSTTSGSIFNVRFLDLNNGNNKYCKCINLGGDKVVYGGKYSSSLGTTLNIILYDKTAKKTYSRSIDVNTGTPSINDLWKAADKTANATNTAIAVNFAGFTEQ